MKHQPRLLMNDQLIKTLMEVYAERGVNLTEIIRDKMFHDLPLHEQVRVLKEHADKMLEGSRHDINKQDLKPAAKRAALMATLAAGFGASGALKEFPLWGPGYKFPTKRVLGMGALAGGASLALSALAEMDAIKARKALYKDFETAIDNPNDNAYLKLIVKNQGHAITPMPLSNPIKDGLKKLTEKADALASRDAEIHGRYAAFKHSYKNAPAEWKVEDDHELNEHFKHLAKEHSEQKTYKPFN